MKDVLAVQGESGYNIASTFSGCGGSSLGYRLAGFNVVWANEFDPVAASVYTLNKQEGCVLNELSIRAVDLETIGNGQRVDVLEGSPPCSKFSMAGDREKSWGKVTGSDSTIAQENVEDLFFDWINAVAVVRPRIAVAENVAGLANGASKGYLIEILKRLNGIGYETTVWKLNASLFGAGTSRVRLFVVATPEGLGRPVMPVPTIDKPYTTKEVFATCPSTPVDVAAFCAEADVTPAKADFGDDASPLVAPNLQLYSKVNSMPPGTVHPERYGIIRVSDHKPCPTIMTADGAIGPQTVGKFHATFPPRRLSVNEYAALSSFPTDFNWGEGSYVTKVGRIGNAVPPLLAAAVARSVRAYLDSTSDGG
jgi:DNA (cytosine-5)-methyltransferase 1